MKKSLKAISICCAAVMAASSFAGCSGSVSASSKAASAAAASAAASSAAASSAPAITQITFATDNFDGDTDGSRAKLICDLFNKKTGITLKIINVPKENYGDNIQAKFVAGEVADVVEGPTDISVLVKQGYLVSLDSYLSDSSSAKLKAIMDKQVAMAKAYTIGGKLYAVASRVPWYQAIWVRKDWMTADGLSMPTTLDGFTKMLETFRDKNGAIALESTNDLEMLDVIANYFGTKTMCYYNNAQKKFVDPMLTAEMKNFLDYMKTLYGEQLLDPEMSTNSSYSKMREKFFTAKSATCIIWEHAYQSLTNGLAKNNQTGATIDFIPIITNPNGNGVLGQSFFVPDEPFCITNTCKNPQAVFDAFFNTYFTDYDFNVLNTVGAEGVDFQIVNGKAEAIGDHTFNDNMAVDPDFKPNFTLPDAIQTMNNFTSKIKAQVTTANSQWIDKIKPETGTTYYDLENDIINKNTELIFKYIMGQITYDEYTAQYKQFDTEKGVGTAIAALNK